MLLKYIKDIISPKKCYSCKKEWHFLCKKCLDLIDYKSPYCYICKKENKDYMVHNKCKNDIYFDKIIVLSKYKNITIKKLIKDSKYYSKKDILEDFWTYLGKLLLSKQKIINKWDYLIIPVPMFYKRKISRWYNHSEILANYIWKETWITVNKKLIKKIKETRQQSKLSKKEREKNLEKSFKINKRIRDNIDKKNIIIVDDIISTWTTLNEVSKLLKNEWCLNIIGITIASN